MKKFKKNCDYCKKEYETNRELQRFCSDYCRIRYQSEQGRIKNKPLKKKDYESRKLIRKLCLMLEPYRKLGDKKERL